MREKLIELLDDTVANCMPSECIDDIADHLIANDVVPVVRCKVCKQWSRNSGIAESPNGHCFCHDIETNGHDFCSYGEKKKVNLEDVVDLEAQTKANNEAMRKVIDFIAGERRNDGKE